VSEERREKPAGEQGTARGTAHKVEMRGHLVHLKNLASRVFTSVMPTASTERRRFAEERKRLLEREQAAHGETEKARQEARAILESISGAFFTLDPEWRFVHVNCEAERFWDKPREDLLGKNIWEVFPQAVGTEIYEVIERAAKEGVSSEFETSSPVSHGSVIAGRIRPSAEGLSVYFQDISKQKGEEKALRESEKFVRQLLRNFPNGSVNVFDRDLRYLLAEGKGLSQESLSPEMLVGKTLHELFPKESADFVIPYYQRAFDGEAVEFELLLGGNVYSIHAAPLHEEGPEVRTIIAVAQNVTETKRAQEERDRLLAQEIEARTQKEERRRIARDLHDVVLQDLAGVLQSLRLTYLQSKGSGLGLDLEEELEALGRATLGLRTAVHDLRGEKERPFVKSVESLVELNRRLTSEREIGLVVEEGFPNGLPGEVGGELLRVIREALTNVRHHSEAKSVVVTLKVEGSDLVAEISDDGQGFDPEAVSGVGLSSMQERAAIVGGRLEIESEVGRGTSVRLRVPVPQTE
jgi:PAS domain S-box-containing protein